jgi:Contractile injection system spike tip protein
MTDIILLTGDEVIFNPNFGQAIVTVRPAKLIGTGKDKIDGKLICIDGDEKKVTVPACPYITQKCTIPGMGMLFIQSLASAQKAQKTKSKGKPVLLKGGEFKAKFTVTSPAQQPSTPNPIPDTTIQYSGTGTFITTNLKVQGI